MCHRNIACDPLPSAKLSGLPIARATGRLSDTLRRLMGCRGKGCGFGAVTDVIGGVGVPPSPPPCCDEASQYASQKNPVTD